MYISILFCSIHSLIYLQYDVLIPRKELPNENLYLYLSNACPKVHKITRTEILGMSLGRCAYWNIVAWLTLG